MKGYFLRGVNDDHILVFRSDDSEELLGVIRRLCASRDKQMKALAEKLEIDWYERERHSQNKNKDTKKKR